VHTVCDESDHDSDDTTEHCMHHVNDDQRKRDPFRVNLSLYREDVSMEVDIGASKTVK
jgi:hypothetical protein